MDCSGLVETVVVHSAALEGDEHDYLRSQPRLEALRRDYEYADFAVCCI
jgi:hypothetical protein